MIVKYMGFLIQSVNASPGLFSVAVEGRGGRIPDKLQGFYTSVGLVKERIDAYLGSAGGKRGKVNAEADAKSGD